MTFSNRMFPTKAVSAWQALNDQQHANLVGLYFEASKAFSEAKVFDISPPPGRSDPAYAVVAEALPASSATSSDTGIT